MTFGDNEKGMDGNGVVSRQITPILVPFPITIEKNNAQYQEQEEEPTRCDARASINTPNIGNSA